MKKIISILMVALIAVSCIFAQGSTDAAPAEGGIKGRTIRFSTTSSEGTTLVDAMHMFADKVAELSNGKIKVEIYPSSQLGDGPQALQNCQLGVQEMTMTQPSYLASNGAKEFTAVCLPYVFRNLEHQDAVIHGLVGEELLATAQPSGTRLVGVGFLSEGARNFFTKTPVKSFEDMKGLKIRCMQNAVDTMMVKALGASPTPIAFSELYSAIQTGVVDGGENPLDGIYSSKFYEVCKHVTIDEHSNIPTVIVFSEVIWNQMSTEERQIVLDAWKSVAATNLKLVQEGEAKYRKALQEAGCSIYELSDKAKWQDAMEPIYKEFGSDCQAFLQKIKNVK
mgnify:FL=1